MWKWERIGGLYFEVTSKMYGIKRLSWLSVVMCLIGDCDCCCYYAFDIPVSAGWAPPCFPTVSNPGQEAWLIFNHGQKLVWIILRIGKVNSWMCHVVFRMHTWSFPAIWIWKNNEWVKVWINEWTMGNIFSSARKAKLSNHWFNLLNFQLSYKLWGLLSTYFF